MKKTLIRAMVGVILTGLLVGTVLVQYVRISLEKSIWKDGGGAASKQGLFTQRVHNTTPWPVYIEKMRFIKVSPNADTRVTLYERLYGGVSVANPDIPENFAVAEKPILIKSGDTKFLGIVMTSLNGNDAVAEGVEIQCRLWFLRFSLKSKAVYTLFTGNTDKY